MAAETIRYDEYTLLHLVAAQLVAGLNTGSAQRAVEEYQKVYRRLDLIGGLTPPP